MKRVYKLTPVSPYPWPPWRVKTMSQTISFPPITISLERAIPGTMLIIPTSPATGSIPCAGTNGRSYKVVLELWYSGDAELTGYYDEIAATLTNP